MTNRPGLDLSASMVTRKGWNRAGYACASPIMTLSGCNRKNKSGRVRWLRSRIASPSRIASTLRPVPRVAWSSHTDGANQSDTRRTAEELVNQRGLMARHNPMLFQTIL